VKRRAFITLLGGAAVAWPLAARAQQPAMPVIGFLNKQSLESYGRYVDAFRQGLRQAGYVDGNNVVIQYRWGGNQSTRLPALAAELARLPVTVLVTSGGDDTVDAARSATTTIPIVTTIGYDPVNGGLVQSLNRPGGNVTGVSVFASDLVPKRVEIAHELAPNAPAIAFLVNPANPDSGLDKAKAEAAAKALGQRVVLLKGASENECDAAFESLAQHQAEVVIVESDPFFNTIRNRLVALARRYRALVVYPRRYFALAGGLISYGSSLTDAYRQLGIYTGRILKGDKASELPFLLPTKFEMVVNLKAATAFGITMPTSLLVRADEVIE
jgi:putative ABC transport system substrate-binding protein